MYKYNKNVNRSLYNKQGDYINISPMKHDIFKQLILELVSIIPLFNIYDNNLLSNKIITFSIGFFVYYQIVEPYIVNKIPYI